MRKEQPSFFRDLFGSTPLQYLTERHPDFIESFMSAIYSLQQTGNVVVLIDVLMFRCFTMRYSINSLRNKHTKFLFFVINNIVDGLGWIRMEEDGLGWIRM